MQELPILNARLEVEAVGFRDFANGRLGVLITPWFMNLVFLKQETGWSSRPQGDLEKVELPWGDVEFTVNQDEKLGAYLSAVLFRSVSDFPDQETAREVATQVMSDLFSQPPGSARRLSRRQLFSNIGGG